VPLSVFPLNFDGFFGYTLLHNFHEIENFRFAAVYVFVVFQSLGEFFGEFLHSYGFG
jgi:hypothetical protein